MIAAKRRYMVLAVLGMSALVGLVLSHGTQWAAAQLGWSDPALGGVPVSRMLALGLSLALALAVLRIDASRRLAEEIVDELSQVSWPGREETGHATLVVVVTVVMSSLYLGLFDAVWMWVTDWFLGARGAVQG